MRKYFKEERLVRVFLMTLIGCCIAFIPICIINSGKFFYYGDYNKEQIMFYSHLHDLVKSGQLSAWDWTADLGSDTVSSYSFYMLGSPFFWISLIFPSSMIVTAMPFLIALKSAVAAVGAYLLTRRFVNHRDSCLIAGVLFGMSSFLSQSIIFNHFHDAVLMLPFLLWSLERLVNENKRFAFAVTVALACMTSYYFFFGQVIFTVIYYVAGLITGRLKFTLRSFAVLAFEAVLGFMISMVIFLPSVLAVIANPRVNDHLSGSELFFYSPKRIYLYIIKNMFMAPNVLLIENFGVGSSNEFDTSAYIPFYSAVGIIAYFRTVKGRDFLKVLLSVCMVMMFVPALNQAFSMFNAMFYGRWFYMPLLIGTVMTARMIEEHYTGKEKVLKKGYLPTVIITGIVLAASATVMYLDKFNVINAGFEDYTLPLLQIVITAVSMGVLWLMIYHPETDEPAKAARILFNRTFAVCTAGMCAIVWYAYMKRGTSDEYIMSSTLEMRDDYISDEEQSSDEFCRVGCSENYINMPVIWGESTIRYFSSTVEPSVIDFYKTAGLKRNTKSDAPVTSYGLMSLLSVKTYYDQAYVDSEGDPLPIGDSLIGTNGTFTAVEQRHDIDISKNTHFIPMGFTFDKACTAQELSDIKPQIRNFTLLETLVLDEKDAKKYSDYIGRYDTSLAKTAKERYTENCEARRNESCYSFKQEGSGFEGRIKLEEKRLVFFSIPYSEYWSAKVNDEPADIIIADGGLMAVACDKGDCTIEFTYHNTSFSTGLIITLCSLGAFAAYALIRAIVIKRRR